MTRPRISKAMAERIIYNARIEHTYTFMGRFVYKLLGEKIYRAENVGYWGRLWERVEVDE